MTDVDRVAPEELVVEAESSHTPADVAGVLLRAAQYITRLEGALTTIAEHSEHVARDEPEQQRRILFENYAAIARTALSHSSPKEAE